MPLKLTEFDASEYLDSDEMIAEFLTASLEYEDPRIFLSAVENVARARGMASIAKATGLGRESLYKALAPGAKPRYDTLLKILRSLGVTVVVTTRTAAKGKPGDAGVSKSRPRGRTLRASAHPVAKST